MNPDFYSQFIEQLTAKAATIDFSDFEKPPGRAHNMGYEPPLDKNLPAETIARLTARVDAIMEALTPEDKIAPMAMHAPLY